MGQEGGKEIMALLHFFSLRAPRLLLQFERAAQTTDGFLARPDASQVGGAFPEVGGWIPFPFRAVVGHPQCTGKSGDFFC